jgi:hypothetical protein
LPQACSKFTTTICQNLCISVREIIQSLNLNYKDLLNPWRVTKIRMRKSSHNTRRNMLSPNIWRSYGPKIGIIRFFLIQSTFCLQLLLHACRILLKPNWYVERSHCVDMRITREILSPNFYRSYGLWTKIFCAKYFVFLAPLKSSWGFEWNVQKRKKVTMCRNAVYKENAVLQFFKELWPLECIFCMCVFFQNVMDFSLCYIFVQAHVSMMHVSVS